MQGAQPVATDVRRMNFWREELVGRRWVSSCSRSRSWWVLVSDVKFSQEMALIYQQVINRWKESLFVGGFDGVVIPSWWWWSCSSLWGLFSPQNVRLLPRLVLFHDLGCIYYLRRQSGTSFGRLAVVFSGNILRFFSCSDFHRHLGRDLDLVIIIVIYSYLFRVQVRSRNQSRVWTQDWVWVQLCSVFFQFTVLGLENSPYI